MDQVQRQVKGKRKKAIADLPPGVGITKSSNGSKVYWRVRLGKRFTGGMIVKKYFEDVAGARAFIDRHKNQKADTGSNTYVLSGDQLAEAKNAFERLAGTGLTMTAAVTVALARHRRPEDALTWEEGLKKWLAAPRKRPLDPRTIQGYTISVQFLASEMKREKLLPHQVGKKDIQDFLVDDEREWEPGTVAAHLRNLKVFFGHLVKEKWVAESPCRHIPEPEILTEIHVLTPSAAEHLLNTAKGVMRVCIGLGAFAGLRTAEIRRLDWAEIGETEIEVKAKKAKTRRNRQVPILPVLRAILDAHVGPRIGPVAPARWKKEFEWLVGHAGYRNDNGESTWPTNSLRHSFGTYRMADVKSDAQVSYEMGNSADMIHRHYRRVVPTASVVKFWAVRPASGAG